MEANQSATGFRLFPFLFTTALVIGGVLALYYLYTSLYGSPSTLSVKLVENSSLADKLIPAESLPRIPVPYEGGDYSVNMWIYINSFNTNRNKRKHIFELRGRYFSTLLVGLGAYKNTLMVRTHTSDLPNKTEETASESVTTPGSQDAATAGSLGHSTVAALFTDITMEDSLLDTPPICDLPEIDMQRWVMVSVVLSGRTIDVYLNGKLKRSCVAPSHFKVDPTGVAPVICDHGGFDGHIDGVGVANYAFNPEQVYKLYLSGPQGSTWNFGKWLGSFFKG